MSITGIYALRVVLAEFTGMYAGFACTLGNIKSSTTILVTRIAALTTVFVIGFTPVLLSLYHTIQ